MSQKGLFLAIVACFSGFVLDAQDKRPDSTQQRYRNKVLVFPVVAYAKETNWVMGVANAYVFKTDRRDTALRFSTIPCGLLYTMNKQIMFAWAGNIFLPKEKYIIRFENYVSRYPDRFWGIGNNTDNRSYESYTFTTFYFNPQLYRKVKKHFYLGLGFDFQRVFNIEYTTDGYFDHDKVLGVHDRRQYQVVGASFYINYDSRNHTYVPNAGEMMRIRLTSFNEWMGSDYIFQTLEIDYRKFLKVSKRTVLGLHAYGWLNLQAPPLRDLGSLSNPNMMRGYFTGRYRDHKLMAVQAEYRFPIVGRFGGVVFAGTGRVGREITDFGIAGFKPSIGTGLRYKVLKQEKLNLRFDVGFGSNNSVNYYVMLAESF